MINKYSVGAFVVTTTLKYSPQRPLMSKNRLRNDVTAPSLYAKSDFVNEMDPKKFRISFAAN